PANGAPVAPPPAAAAPPAQAVAPAPQAPPRPRIETVRIPSGTEIKVRIDQTISTAKNQAGDSFPATLEYPVVVDGRELLPRGTKFEGRVTESDTSGRLKGRTVLGLTLAAFELRGRSYRVTTSLEQQTSDAHKKRNVIMIGGGSGLGALIGGLVGGGKGAAIGAAAGAAAGTGGAVATGKRRVEVPAETEFTFRLRAPVQVRDRM
ncbi:MAG: hypothetical protein ACRD9L_12030, partial [Bryobacteraceae bacterium]